jgi:hypothetical protein
MNDNPSNTNFAETYSYSDKKKKKKKNNRFQQSTLLASVNLGGQAPFFKQGPSGHGVREEEREEEVKPEMEKDFFEEKPKKKRKRDLRRISSEDRYIQIAVQMAKIKNGPRVNRAKIYVSLMTEDSNMYNVKLSGALTTEVHEIRRGAKENPLVLSVIDSFIERLPGKIMLARLHYRPNLYFNGQFPRKNLKSAIIAVYGEDEIMKAELFLFHEYITIPLDESMTNDQIEYYCCSGLYQEPMGEED